MNPERRRRPWRRRAIWMVLAAFLGAALWLWLAQTPATRIELPDGRIATILGITSGQYHVQPGRRWVMALQWIPTSWQQRMGWEAFVESGRTHNLEAPCLVVWLEMSSWKSSDGDSFVLHLVDEAGFQAHGAELWWGLPTGQFVLFNHPRRDPVLRLQPMFITQGATAGPSTQAHVQALKPIVLPNPDRREAPRWNAQAMPATWREGPLEVTLQRLEVGPPQWVRRFRLDQPKPGSVALAEFTVREHGEPTPRWALEALGVFDATENEAWLGVGNLGPELGLESVGQGVTRLRFVWPLWSTEPAWKLRLRFGHVPTTPLEPAEQAWVRDIPVPAEDAESTIGLRTNVNGADLEILSLAGDQAPQNPPFYNDHPGITWLRLKTHHMPKWHALSVVMFTSEDVALVPTLDYGGGEICGFQVPPGAKKLNACIGLVRQRWAEFTVRPEFMTTSGLPKPIPRILER